MNHWSRLTAVAAAAALAAGAALAQGGGMRATLTGPTSLHAGEQVAGVLAPTTRIHVTVVLKLRNRGALHALIARIARPGAGGETLSPKEFTAEFGPTVGQAQAVAHYLARSGFSHVVISSNRELVSGDAPASAVESAFGTHLVRVRTGPGRIAFANTTAARVPSALGDTVLAVLGLQNVHGLHTLASRSAQRDIGPKAVTGHDPTAFASIYSGSGVPTGAGITVGIVSEGSLTNVMNDLQTFTSNNGLATVSTQVVNTDGTSGDTSGDAEWDLDSQDIVGMAGGQIGQIIFYNIPNLSNSTLTDDFSTIVNADATNVINVSLGECETSAQQDGSAAADDQLFQQAVTQGQTFSVSSGDSGADECGTGGTTPSWPASSQYVVAVGGTTLNTSGSTWTGETVWSGTGGSPSTFEPMPSWQQGVGQNAGHSTRGVPDVAFDADPNSGALIIVDGSQQQYGGTSLASPLFVGAWARMMAADGTGLGFAAPLLYQLPAGDFHDVTSGSNGGETAAVGWDYTTGFGSLIMNQAVNDLGSGGGGGGGNNPPVANNGSVTTTQNQAVSGTLSASDPDGDPLTFSIVSAPGNGTVSITNTATGAFTYTPNSGFTGNDSFTFKANDGQSDSNVATESVTVNPPAGGCPAGYTSYNGSVTQGNDDYQPNETYYHASRGTESGILNGPAGTDFDLYLYKWNRFWGWQIVASSTSNTSNETIHYNGSAGYYIWDIYAYAGSGTYGFCLQHP